MSYVPFAELVGKTLSWIKIGGLDDVMTFCATDGTEYRMQHHQDCCENVEIDEIHGDLNDLLDTPIIVAEERTSDTAPRARTAVEYEPESETWTFYELRTLKGSVTIRWWGYSNGYYSEAVAFERVSP